MGAYILYDSVHLPVVYKTESGVVKSVTVDDKEVIGEARKKALGGRYEVTYVGNDYKK